MSTVVLRTPDAIALPSPVDGVSRIVVDDHEFYVRDEWIEPRDESSREYREWIGSAGLEEWS